jgi:hypothetical protein
VGITYGQGYDPFTGSPKGKCVEFNGDSDLIATTTPAGQTTDFRIVEIEDTDKFHSAMNMSAAASIGVGPFSADAATQYASDRKITSYSNSLVVEVRVRNQRKALKAFNLTTSAAEALKRDPADFYRMCGTYFMAGLESGGDFAVVMRIRSQNDEEQRSTHGELEASYGMFGSVSGKFDESMQRLVAKGALQAEIVRRGTTDAIPQLTPQDIRAYAMNYPKQVSDAGGAPWPIAATMVDYQSINPRAKTLRAEEQFLNGVASDLAAARQLRNDLLYVQANPGEFLGIDLGVIANDLQTVQAATKKIEAVAAACSADPVAKCKGGTSAVPSVTLPARLPWHAIDPKLSSKQCIGRVARGERKSLRLEGQWSAWADVDTWFDASSLEITYLSTSDGSTLANVRYPMFTMRLPDFDREYEVCVRIIDSVYKDNRERGLRAVMFADGADRRYASVKANGRNSKLLAP